MSRDKQRARTAGSSAGVPANAGIARQQSETQYIRKLGQKLVATVPWKGLFL